MDDDAGVEDRQPARSKALATTHVSAGGAPRGVAGGHGRERSMPTAGEVVTPFRAKFAIEQLHRFHTRVLLGRHAEASAGARRQIA